MRILGSLFKLEKNEFTVARIEIMTIRLGTALLTVEKI